VCSSHVLTPHNASLNEPEAGLGLHQRGGWHCHCNFGLRMASPPQNLPFSLCGVLLPCANATQHTMLPWTNLMLGWGCISLGKGPSSGLHGNSKSDAVLESWLIICDSFIINGCKKIRNIFGRKWSQMAKLPGLLTCVFLGARVR
jgi:hypothetical protein